MRLGIALVCVAACGGGAGVDLEIRSDAAIRSVEIFIGSDHCYERDETGAATGTECEGGVAWLAGQQPPPGKVFVTLRDAEHRLPEARLVPERQSESDPWTIHLEAAGFYTTPKVIAVVGFDAAGKAAAVSMIWDQRIPAHSAQHWVVELEAAAPAGPDFRRAPTDTDTPLRVAVWGREGDELMAAGSRCAVVQQWDADKGEWKGTFIVPDSDRDCDGEVLPQLECRDRYFNLNNTDLQTPVRCVGHPDATLDSSSACIVGTTACRDGTSSDDACNIADSINLARICVPDAICDLCSEPYGLEACVAMAAKQPSVVSHVECRFQADAIGNTCGVGHPGSAAELDLPFACEAIDVRPGGMPLMATGQPVLMIGAARFEAQYYTSATGGCTVTVYFKDGNVALGSSHWVLLGVLSPYTGDVMLVPLRIDVAASAANCTLVQQETEKCVNVGLDTDNIGQCALALP